MRWTTAVAACALTAGLGACTSPATDDDPSTGSGNAPVGATKEHTAEGVTFDLPEDWTASDRPGADLGKPGEGTVLVLTVPTYVSSGNPADDFREELGPLCPGEVTATQGIKLGGTPGWDLRCDVATANGSIRQLSVEREDTWYEVQFSFASGTPTSRRDAIVDNAARTWRFA